MEKLYMMMYRLPFLSRFCDGVRIATSNSCTHREHFYIDLVDVVHNSGNEIVIDRRMTGGKRETYAVPHSVTKAVVEILK